MSNADLAYTDTLWKAAEALRGQVDAAEYTHVVLGLFLQNRMSLRRLGGATRIVGPGGVPSR